MPPPYSAETLRCRWVPTGDSARGFATRTLVFRVLPQLRGLCSVSTHPGSATFCRHIMNNCTRRTKYLESFRNKMNTGQLLVGACRPHGRKESACGTLLSTVFNMRKSGLAGYSRFKLYRISAHQAFSSSTAYEIPAYELSRSSSWTRGPCLRCTE